MSFGKLLMIHRFVQELVSRIQNSPASQSKMGKIFEQELLQRGYPNSCKASENAQCHCTDSTWCQQWHRAVGLFLIIGGVIISMWNLFGCPSATPVRSAAALDSNRQLHHVLLSGEWLGSSSAGRTHAHLQLSARLVHSMWVQVPKDKSYSFKGPWEPEVTQRHIHCHQVPCHSGRGCLRRGCQEV